MQIRLKAARQSLQRFASVQTKAIMDDIDSTISEISRSSLDCMEKVAATAASDLDSMPIDIRRSLASFNNFTGGNLVNAFANAQTETLYALDALTKEPIVARVTYIDEDDQQQIVYITRTKTPSTTTPFKVASYRSPIGKLASARPGDTINLRLGSRDVEVHITSSTKLAPVKQDRALWILFTPSSMSKVWASTRSAACDSSRRFASRRHRSICPTRGRRNAQRRTKATRRAFATRSELI